MSQPRAINPHGIPKLIAAVKGVWNFGKFLEAIDADTVARSERDTDRPPPPEPGAAPTCGETSPTGWHCTLAGVAHDQCLLERDRT